VNNASFSDVAGTCAIPDVNELIDCLQYAHKNGCPWDSKTCYNAALHGDIDCLQYAHEHGVKIYTVSLSLGVCGLAYC
jgi:hypothetical protein